jgi:hypothetical protein
MKLFLWSAGTVSGPRRTPEKVIPQAAPSPDPRAVRYFSIAARYNAAAAELGYLSLGDAIKAGRMPEVLRRAETHAPEGVES